jgi:hypothetical protein
MNPTVILRRIEVAGINRNKAFSEGAVMRCFQNLGIVIEKYNFPEKKVLQCR